MQIEHSDLTVCSLCAWWCLPVSLLHVPFRAHVDSASELVKLYAEKFDLLRSGASAQKKPSGSAASQATIKALEELKAVINGHLQVGGRDAGFA